jgi:hypothetical protein
MSKELTSFFTELSANPLLIEKFESDPAAMLDEFRLSESERELVMTRDLDTLNTRLAGNGSVGGHNGRKKKKAAKKKPAKKK